ncbi:MAG: TetR/AcrR family transcriptional regulator [Parasphingorhabdus sp.]
MLQKTPASKGEKRRAEILATARTQLIECGYEGFSMREVAASLDTKLGHIQYYFSSKNKLLEAVIRDEFRVNLETAQTIVSEAADSEAVLGESVRALIGQWYSEGKYIYALMSFMALHNDGFRRLNDELNKEFYTVVGNILSAKDPSLSSSQISKKTKLITALMDGGLLHLHISSHESETFMQDIIETVNIIAGTK